MPPQSPLTFTMPVILVGGGDIAWDSYELLSSRNYPVIAVDGGANPLREKAIVPDALIGDFDSVTHPASFSDATKTFEISEQASTDFEKALYSIEAPLFIAFGFWGQRLDHSLAALHTLTKYRNTKQVLLVDHIDLLFTPQGPFSLASGQDTRVSVFPLDAVRFTESSGLQFPLNGLFMKSGADIGISNRSTAARFSITPEPADASNYAVILPNTALEPLVREWHTPATE